MSGIIYKEKKKHGKNATLGVCIRYKFFIICDLWTKKKKRKKNKRIGARIFII